MMLTTVNFITSILAVTSPITAPCLRYASLVREAGIFSRTTPFSINERKSYSVLCTFPVHKLQIPQICFQRASISHFLQADYNNYKLICQKKHITFTPCCILAFKLGLERCIFDSGVNVNNTQYT